MIKHRFARFPLLIVGTIFLAFLVAGCGGDEEAASDRPAATEEGPATATEEGPAIEPIETVDVTIGLTPFFDYMLWPFAKEKGLDAELGINLEFEWLAGAIGPGVQALRRGSIDVIDTCTACNFPFYEQVPTLRDWLITNQFKGFILVGRTGAPSYDELVESGMTPEEAKAEVFEFIKGRTFAIHKPAFGALVNGMLENAGLDPADVEILDFADDVKAATAFIGGTGDFYMGGLPQESKMLLDHPDRFVNMGGTEILGPGGLWYSTAASEQEWLEENHEAVMRLIAIWYRASRFVNERIGDVVPVFRREVNLHGGANFTEKQVEFTISEFLEFMSIDEAREKMYNPDSELYWKNSLDFYAEQNKESGELPADIDVGPFNVEEQFFRELLEREDLIQWINAPLE